MKRLLVILLFSLISLSALAPEKSFYVNQYEYKKEVEHIRHRIEFDRFLKDLGYYESSNTWDIYNKFGYIGEWQLGRAALKDVGYSHITFKAFKKDPSIFPRTEQKKAVKALIGLNIQRLSEVIDEYKGKTIMGVEITTSGLIAAAHLGGARGVKLFLITKGRYNPRDAYGTTILKYMKLFKRYKI